MKKFEVSGWYKYNDDEGYEIMLFLAKDKQGAIKRLCNYFYKLHFYKITVEEIE